MKTLRLYFAIALLLALPCFAQENESRTALVVGCDYPGTSLQLPSPVADARALAATLEKQLGFQVVLTANPTRKQLLDATDRFGETLGKRGGVGLFYFSGHGAQNDGTNYLVPAGANLGFREDLATEAIAAERVVTRMEAAGNRVNLLFLDACRNNPLPSSRQKSALAKGLGGMNAANGMLIGFATARNTVANDSGAGSLYTNALLKHIVTPGLSVTDMLTRVNAEVRKVSGGSQIPFMEVGLSDVFSFVPPNPTGPPSHSKPASANDPVIAATKEAPFVNSLGQEFVPVPGTNVLFCRWDTRVSDWQAFIQQEGDAVQRGISALDRKEVKWVMKKELSWKNPGFSQTGRHPVVGVSWEDAQRFCGWLAKKEGRSYRLPTDAEWSAAVGSQTYPWGGQFPPPAGAGNYRGTESRLKSDASGTAGWSVIEGYSDGFARTSPVGAFKSNFLGLYDMGGNVCQWCEDEYRAAMNSADAIRKAPALQEEKASDGTRFRVLRGGSWRTEEEIGLRSMFRDRVHSAYRNDMNGFRCVLVVPSG